MPKLIHIPADPEFPAESYREFAERYILNSAVILVTKADYFLRGKQVWRLHHRQLANATYIDLTPLQLAAFLDLMQHV